MRKIFLFIMFLPFLSILLVEKPVVEIDFEEAFFEFSDLANIENAKIDSLKEEHIAGKYGIYYKMIADGYVLSSKNNDNIDLLIFLKVKEEDDIDEVVKSLEIERYKIERAYYRKSNDIYIKLQNSILKIKSTYVLLAISDNALKMDEEFSKLSKESIR